MSDKPIRMTGQQIMRCYPDGINTVHFVRVIDSTNNRLGRTLYKGFTIGSLGEMYILEHRIFSEEYDYLWRKASKSDLFQIVPGGEYYEPKYKEGMEESSE